MDDFNIARRIIVCPVREACVLKISLFQDVSREEMMSSHQIQTAATALNLLGRLMVNILDIIFTSEEKEKVKFL